MVSRYVITQHVDYMQAISMKDATITEKIQYLKNIVLNY